MGPGGSSSGSKPPVDPNSLAAKMANKARFINQERADDYEESIQKAIPNAEAFFNNNILPLIERIAKSGDFILKTDQPWKQKSVKYIALERVVKEKGFDINSDPWDDYKTKRISICWIRG